MIDELAKALACNQDLDEVARRLEEQAKAEQQERIRQITHDLGIAKLIQYGLCEPKESSAYAICKAYLRTYKRKYCPGGDKLAHQLLKEAERSNSNDNN